MRGPGHDCGCGKGAKAGDDADEKREKQHWGGVHGDKASSAGRGLSRNKKVKWWTAIWFAETLSCGALPREDVTEYIPTTMLALRELVNSIGMEKVLFKELK